VNLKIQFLLSPPRKQARPIAEIYDVNTVPVGPDPTGRLKGGHVKLSGHLRKSDRVISMRYISPTMTRWEQVSTQYEWFEDGYTDDGDRPMSNCSFFLMAYEKNRRTLDVDSNTLSNAEARGNQEINGDKFSIDIGFVFGLILETVDPETSVYRRIGAFRHMWGDGRTFEDNPKPEDYPEFLDFDPNNFERHTITII
jgi:hypothetical protein